MHGFVEGYFAALRIVEHEVFGARDGAPVVEQKCLNVEVGVAVPAQFHTDVIEADIFAEVESLAFVKVEIEVHFLYLFNVIYSFSVEAELFA